MTQQDLEKLVEAKATEAVGKQIDTALKGQMKELVQDAVNKLKPSPEEEKVNALAKEKRFASGGEFLNAIYRFRHFGQFDDRLVYLNTEGKQSKPAVDASQKATLVEGTDSAGGFLVFEEFRNTLLEIGIENSIIRGNGAFVIPMGSDTLRIPRVVDTTHTSTVHGGVYGVWEAEGATMTESEPTFGECMLTAHNFNGYTKASNQLLADSATPLEPLLRRMFGEAWAWFTDYAFIRGTGSGQPLGILNAPCLVSVTRQDTNNVYGRDLINVYSRMLPGSRDKAIWIMNHEVLPEIMALSDLLSGANAAGTQLAWLKNLVDPIEKTILGRPYFVTEKMSALGDAGDIGFFDLGYYFIGDRQQITVDASTHVYFTTNHTAWRFTLRVDGQPWLASALTPRYGSATLSPFVVLSAAS